MAEKIDDKPSNADMSTTIYRAAIVILLAGILIMQWQILNNTSGGSDATAQMATPPTYGDFMNATDSGERLSIYKRTPLVRLQGVGINNQLGALIVEGTVSLDSASIAQIRGR